MTCIKSLVQTHKAPLLIPIDQYQAINTQSTENPPISGIELSSEDAIKLLGTDQIKEILKYPLIQLRFPKFQDGRSYSIAYLLKSQYAYQGELRVCGKINPDQVTFLIEVGFDSIELDHEDQWTDFEKMREIVQVRYQWQGFGIRSGR
jgi:uncharacterized protein (DUF934 family)